jgi:hypothetical protein
LPKWKDCDASTVMKTQLEFLARTQTERGVRIDAQKLVPVGSPMIRAIAALYGPRLCRRECNEGAFRFQTVPLV